MKRVDGALGVLGLLLLGVLAVELLPAAAEPGAAVDPVAGVPAQAIATALAEVPPIASWADAALGRPLFNPDRRAPQVGPAARESLPRLAGTIRTAGSLLAIFQPDGSGKPIVVARDGTVAGWTVTDIADGAVTLVRAGRTDTLRLSYSNRPVVAQPVAPPAPVILHDKRADPFLQP